MRTMTNQTGAAECGASLGRRGCARASTKAAPRRPPPPGTKGDRGCRFLPMPGLLSGLGRNFSQWQIEKWKLTMAIRGKHPDSPNLRIITGTHRADRHGEISATKASVRSARKSFGNLEQPAGLKGEALKAWKKFIAPAGWLDGSREPSAIAFCELWAEFRSNPTEFLASKHAQLRGYMADLGITDERNRINDEPKTKDPFFDD